MQPPLSVTALIYYCAKSDVENGNVLTSDCATNYCQSDAIGAIPAGMDGQCPCFLCLELRKYLSGAGQGCHNALTVQKACQTCVPVQDPNIVTLPGM